MPIGKVEYVIFRCGHVNQHPYGENGATPNNYVEPLVEAAPPPPERPTTEELYQELKELVHPPVVESNLTPSVKATPLTNCGTELKVHENFSSCDSTMRSYDFQTEGVKFIQKTNLRCLIADATGLGKTIQALLALRETPDLQPFPVLILVKSSIIYQWSEEYRRWANPLPMKVCPVITKDHLIPGFEAYVMSMDLLGRMKPKDLEVLAALKIQTVILDEVHNYKNPEAARSKNLIRFLQANGIEKIIALSATPIKNRADEYFTILNLLDPTQFYSLMRFRNRWLTQNDKYQYTRLNPYLVEDFKTLTSKYILRREKHDVLTNLPPLSRNYVYVEIEDENLKKSYNKTLDLFSNWLNDSGGKNTGINATELLGWLARLRAITGAAKCQNAIDFAQEHLDSTDENLTIGINHISVRDTIKMIFQDAGYSCESLSGEDNSYTKNRIVNRFQNGDFRLLVLNMKSGGEGLNLQNCANALILERAWNAADEEQFEGRFHRNGQLNAVSVTYFIARGTIDQFFHEMVSYKRKIVGEILVKDWNFTSDSDSIRELSEIIVRNKL